jgi:hypothetical protein
VISSSHFIKTQFCQIFAEEEEEEQQQQQQQQQNVCPAVGSARKIYKNNKKSTTKMQHVSNLAQTL